MSGTKKREKREIRERVLRCQRLLVLGTIAGLADERADQDRYKAIYDAEFYKLPRRLQMTQAHDLEVAAPARALFDQYGVLGLRERVVREGWAHEFD